MTNGINCKVLFNDDVNQLTNLATIGDQNELAGTKIKFGKQVDSWVPKPFVVIEEILLIHYTYIRKDTKLCHILTLSQNIISIIQNKYINSFIMVCM